MPVKVPGWAQAPTTRPPLTWLVPGCVPVALEVEVRVEEAVGVPEEDAVGDSVEEGERDGVADGLWEGGGRRGCMKK